MGRRRRNDDELLELTLKLGGVVILLSLLSPDVRNFIKALGALALLLLVLAALGLLGVLVYKIIRKKRAGLETTDIIQEFTASLRNPPIEASTSQILTTAALIENLRTIDWFQFEKLVALAYEHRGYSVTRRGGANPDGGIDLVIEKDGQKSAVQCKQWKTWNVGVKAVREFLGALTDAQIQHGIFITLNGYTGDAKHLAEKHGIEIINETGLTAMLEGLPIHQDPRVIEILEDTRKFCPKCEREMVLRTAEKGPNPGQQFWGCSGYPRCRFTMPAG